MGTLNSKCGNTTALNNTGIPGVYWLAIGS